ncbi:MAG: hypothetical protein Q7J85_00900 [Bacillota bacterium]|nr:hypothetical protein [Bacillota bacterium]
MKKPFLMLIFMLFTVTIFVGCIPNVGEDPSKSDEPGMIGYVMSREDDRILVINPEAYDFSATGGISEYYDAIWCWSLRSLARFCSGLLAAQTAWFPCPIIGNGVPL